MAFEQWIFHAADRLTEPANPGPFEKWVVGTGVACVAGLYGLSCCITQRASVPTARLRRSHLGNLVEVNGTAAISWGIVLITIGMFIHFHWFWSSHPKLVRVHEIPKYLSLLAFIGAIFFHIFTML